MAQPLDALPKLRLSPAQTLSHCAGFFSYQADVLRALKRPQKARARRADSLAKSMGRYATAALTQNGQDTATHAQAALNAEQRYIAAYPVAQAATLYPYKHGTALRTDHDACYDIARKRGA